MAVENFRTFKEKKVDEKSCAATHKASESPQARRRLQQIRRFVVLALLGSTLGIIGVAPKRIQGSPARSAVNLRRWAMLYNKLPLSFEVNRGQTDSRVKFLSRGQGYTLFLTGRDAVL
ncbi:MAG: hypothetical protein M1423_08465, partial [Acidobacteria bacterium]|nr:hypothetical protein [Acidobacteriota bacterium]